MISSLSGICFALHPPTPLVPLASMKSILDKPQNTLYEMRYSVTEAYFLVSVAERRLQANEFPHNLYIQNYSTATATCITLRKWMFSQKLEKTLLSDPRALHLIYTQVWTVFKNAMKVLYPCLRAIVVLFLLQYFHDDFCQ